MTDASHQSTVFDSLKAGAVHDAARRIAPHIVRTPLVRSAALSARAGGDVYLKLETAQTTGSYKLRGALNVLSTLSADARERGVVASSAGNHGMGVALAAKSLGIRARIYVPATAPDVKKSGIRALGAELDDSQPDYDAAMSKAMAFGRESGRTFVNPCAGATLLAGQGTVALEIVADLPDVRTVVINVGGGGLLGGCASLLRREHPDVRIVGAQSVNTDAMARSLEARRVVEIENRPTLADGLAGQIDAEALEIGQQSLDDMMLVTEEEIERAIAFLQREHDVRSEGAGACGVAAILSRKLKPDFPCAVIVTGGNIDEARWKAIVAKHS
jgi:threonine dehydratase